MAQNTTVLVRGGQLLALCLVGVAQGAFGCTDTDPLPLAATTGAAGGGTGGEAGAGGGAGEGGQGGAKLPEVFWVSGTITDGSRPLEGAIVMQGGGAPDFTTGPDGVFEIQLTTALPGVPTLIATKVGYRTRGHEVTSVTGEPIVMALVEVEPPDNDSTYEFGHPGWGSPDTDISTAYCGHCHTTLTAQFQESAHVRATNDPLLQDLYAGVASAFNDAAACAAAGGEWRAGIVPGSPGSSSLKCYVGSGVLPDLNDCGDPGDLACDDPTLPAGAAPVAFGRCADCHALGMEGPTGGRNLHDAEGIAFDFGNHCDACHHIRDIDLDAPPGLGGRVVMQRPRETTSDEIGAPLMQAMFGPLPDVANAFMGGSYQPKFKTAELCAGCHEQKQEALLPGASLDPTRWPDGLPTHSTFSEWLSSPFGDGSTPCQGCHMPPTDGLFNTVDVATAADAGIVFGFGRPPEDIRSHVFRGPLMGTPRFIDSAVALTVSAAPDAGTLGVQVTIQNVGAGHAIPTGEPMRSLVLLVRAEGCGEPFAPAGGMTVFDVGGSLATGIAAVDAAIAGAVIDWPSGAAAASIGDVVRVVRPTGAFDDYAGIGFFADPSLPASDKGLEIQTPVGEATIVAIDASAMTLDASLPIQPGDRLFVGDAAAWPPSDGAPSRNLAGSAGYAFARVMVDPGGARLSPHYRAVDIASDNRIPPASMATTTHVFTPEPGCSSATVSAALLYRPVPTHLARERGWAAQDHVIASHAATVPLR